MVDSTFLSVPLAILFSVVLTMWSTATAWQSNLDWRSALHEWWSSRWGMSLHVSDDSDDTGFTNTNDESDNDSISFKESIDPLCPRLDNAPSGNPDQHLHGTELPIENGPDPNDASQNARMPDSQERIQGSADRLLQEEVAQSMMDLRNNEPIPDGTIIEQVKETTEMLSETSSTLIVVQGNVDPLNASIKKKENDLIIYALSLYKLKGYRNGEGYLKMTVMAELAALTTTKKVSEVVLPGKSLEESVSNWDGAGTIPEDVPGVAYIDRHTSYEVTTFFEKVEEDLIQKATQIFSGNLPEAAKMKGMMDWFHLFRDIGCSLWHCMPSASKEDVLAVIEREFKRCGSRNDIEAKKSALCKEFHMQNFPVFYAEDGGAKKRGAEPASHPVAKKSKRSVGPPPTRQLDVGDKILYHPASESWQQKQRQRYALQKNLLTCLAADHSLRGDHRALVHILLKEVEDETPSNPEGLDAMGMVHFALLIGIVSALPDDSYIDTKMINLSRELQQAGLLSANSLAAANLPELKNALQLNGYDTEKAELLKQLAITLKDDYDGVVPSTYDELLTLPGIGNPEAKAMIQEAFSVDFGQAINSKVKMALVALDVVQLEDDFFPPHLKKKGASKVVFEQITDLHVQRSLQTWLPQIDLPEYIKVQLSFLRILTEHCLLVDQGQDWEKRQKDLVDLTIDGFPSQSQKELRTMVKRVIDYFEVIAARNEKKKESQRKLAVRRAKQNETRKRKRQAAKEE